MYTDEEVAALIEAAEGHRTGRRHQSDRPSGLKQLIILAADTGHRLSAILGLEFRDWNPDARMYGAITWRADLDKVGNEHTTAVTKRTREAIRTQRQRQATVDPNSYVFPAPARDGPVRPDVASVWLRAAEKKAKGVEHKPQRLWHGFRRRWATKRKDRPRPDVAAAGGWTSEETLNRYQQTDPDTVEDVVLNPGRELRRAE